ncbi:MAG TPA: MazG-like family protein [Kiloniellales bacterium]
MKALTFSDLRRANLARVKRWHPGGLADWSLADWACAMAGEAGEACNVVKKLNRERDRIAGNTANAEQLQVALAREIADTLIYLDLLAARAGIDLDRAVVKTFNAKSIKVGFPERLP